MAESSLYERLGGVFAIARSCLIISAMPLSRILPLARARRTRPCANGALNNREDCRV